ncbi:MAG TPA: metal-dependent transcriptional regulator [Acidobacteriota bacterium]|nr:metal-dependent transcriptional regulator [Acidobacteriota bacterium]
MTDPLTALFTAASLALLAAFLFWPGKGLYFRLRDSQEARRRIRIEDVLKHIQKYENQGLKATLESVAGAAQISLDEAGEVLSEMKEQGLLAVQGGDYGLTRRGRQIALHVIRTHRLWERYLADRTGYQEAEWHQRAEVEEHRLSRQQTDRLFRQLGNPTHDPHGDPIPSAEGPMVSHGGRPLTAIESERPVRIVHLEDEPATVYAQLVAEGLHPGMTVRLLDRDDRRIRFRADGEEHVLAPILAENISVVAAPQDESAQPEEASGRLSELQPGQRARVVSVSPSCRGLERRRFMDLGILPGTLIEVERRSPSGDPTAYRVRGATIALRRHQAGYIHVGQVEEPQAQKEAS